MSSEAKDALEYECPDSVSASDSNSLNYFAPVRLQGAELDAYMERQARRARGHTMVTYERDPYRGLREEDIPEHHRNIRPFEEPRLPGDYFSAIRMIESEEESP